MTPSASGMSPSSGDSAALSRLSADQRARLSEVLERYLSALENDAPLSKDALIAENPDLAEALGDYFGSLEALHDMAAGFGGSPDRADAPAEPTPAGKGQIGDFELVREIGRGGMGVVYEARQISLDRRVALKLLPFAAVLDARQIARFKHEAQAAAQLHHPNIVPVFAIGVERGVHYYAMQFIDGQPLDRVIDDLRATRTPRRPRTASVSASLFGWKALPEADETRDERRAPTIGACLASAATNKAEYYRSVMRLGIQAAEALDAAHEYGVVHRDVKPSNLLLEADGKLWVTDFGLARCQRDAGLTRTGDIVGTMRYMSPEQAAGQSARVDHRTDIYSLGVTLYELVGLQPAFPEERGPALLKQIDSYDPPPLRRIRPDVPADLETVIGKAMARERDDRYASACELADDLRRVLDGKATVARPPTALDRASRWAWRNRRLAAATTLVLLLMVAALAAGTVLIGRASVQAVHNARRADRLYASARQMLDQLGGQLAEELSDVPGADPIRRKLLEQTRQYYQEFLDDAKSDPQLGSSAAATYGKLGSLLDQLGSAEEALSAHQAAAELLLKMDAARPGVFSTQKSLALAESNWGLALARTGRHSEARDKYDRAIRRQEKLLSRSPRATDVEADLAATQCNRGLLAQELHQASQAEASFQSAIDHLRHVIDADPGNPDYLRKLAAACNNLAGVQWDDRPQQAVALYTQALSSLAAAGRSMASDFSFRRETALTRNNLAAALVRTRRYSEARSAYQQAIASREELVHWAPARTTYRVDLAVSLNNLGMLENRAGDFSAAESCFRRAIDTYASISERLPGDFIVESNLGGVYNNLGIALERAGNLEAAARAFSDAIDRQEAVCRRAPEALRFQELLATHRANRDRVVNKLGQIEQSTRAAERTSLLTDRNGGQP